MNLLAILMTVLFAFQMTCSPIALAASETSVSIDSGVKGQAKCNKVGALLLSDGLAIMSGNTIEVTGKAQGSSASPGPQLDGVIYKTISQGGGVIKAYAFFNGGSGISQIANAACSEHVDLNDGTKISGPISSVNPSQVVVASQSVPIGQVASIHSARAFQFSYKEGASTLNFQPSCLKASGGKIKSDKGITGKQIAIGLVIAVVIAAAISIPIACSHHGHSSPPPQPVASNSQNVAPRMPSFATMPRRFPRTSSSSSSSSSSSGFVTVTEQSFSAEVST